MTRVDTSIPLLFHKFSRLVQSSDGAGLGLYLVLRIAERHGGRVWCEAPGQAFTRFRVLLPEPVRELAQT